jgi:hypothetical protein
MSATGPILPDYAPLAAFECDSRGANLVADSLENASPSCTTGRGSERFGWQCLTFPGQGR